MEESLIIHSGRYATLRIDIIFLRRYDLASKRLGEVEGNLYGTSLFAVPLSLNHL